MEILLRNPAAAAVMVSLLAGCAGESLGPEYGEIGEEESGLQFYAPGMEGGYRKFIYGQDEQFIKRTIGMYGPKEGEYPHAQLIYVEMPPRFFLSRSVPPQDTISDWSEFENRTITHGPAGTAVNKIGRIDYAAFLADDLSCAVFRQLFGTTYGTGGGKQLLDGYYCKGVAPIMTKGEVVALAKVIGHRKYGAIGVPAGWSDAENAATGFDKDEAKPGGSASSEGYARSAGANYRAGDYDRTIQDYIEAIRLAPDVALGYHDRALAD